MNRIKQLLEQRAAKLAEWNTAAEAGDDAKATALEAEVSAIDKQIESARATEAKLAEARARGEAIAAAAKAPTREAALPTLAHEGTHKATAGEDRARFSSLARQLVEVRHLQVTGAPLSGGVVEARRKYGHSEERAAQGAGEGVAQDGGVLVQEDFINDLMPIILDDGGIPGRCAQRPVGGNRLIVNRIKDYSKASSYTGFATSYWVNEGSAPTASQPEFERNTYELRKVAALVYASEELLEDAPQFASELNQNVGLELMCALGDMILNGNGTSQPQGIIGLAPTVSIDKEVGQAARTLVAENLVKMFARFQPFQRPNCVVLYNKGLETQLPLLNAAVGVGGGLVYMPPGGLSQAPYGTLYGYPLVPSQFCKARGTVGDIVVADLSQYLLAMKTSGVKAAVSMHVAFTTDEQAFRFTLRCEGRPRLSTAITPKNCVSGETLSPFVTLATRA